MIWLIFRVAEPSCGFLGPYLVTGINSAINFDFMLTIKRCMNNLFSIVTTQKMERKVSIDSDELAVGNQRQMEVLSITAEL